MIPLNVYDCVLNLSGWVCLKQLEVVEQVYEDPDASQVVWKPLLLAVCVFINEA